MTEKIMVFNGYGGSNRRGNAVAQWLKNLGVGVAIVSELGRLDDDLSEVGTVYHANDNPKDCAVVVMGKRPWGVLGVQRVQLTRKIKREERPLLWRDRWYVRVRRWNRVYYSIHGNAVIQNEDGTWRQNPGARAWKSAMAGLQEDILRDLEAGRRVRVGGDFNFRESDAVLSPNRFFKTLGMSYFHDGRVMWFAWTPSKDVLVKKQVRGVAPGADAHGSLYVELKKRRRLTRR